MTRFGSVAVMAVLPLVLGFAGTDARAAPVTFHFAGTCFSGASPGNCAYFGLSDGDPVSGSLTVEEARLSTTQFASIAPTDPELAFSFTFGDLTVGKSDLDPTSVLRVMLVGLDGRSIWLQNSVRACLNALFPCHTVQPGSEVLSIGTFFGTADRYVSMTTTHTAAATGRWTVASVPEPIAANLIVPGLVALLWRVRRQRVTEKLSTVFPLRMAKDGPACGRKDRRFGRPPSSDAD